MKFLLQAFLLITSLEVYADSFGGGSPGRNRPSRGPCESESINLSCTAFSYKSAKKVKLNATIKDNCSYKVQINGRTLLSGRSSNDVTTYYTNYGRLIDLMSNSFQAAPAGVDSNSSVAYFAHVNYKGYRLVGTCKIIN